MKAIFEKIEDYCTGITQFYTVRIGENRLTEYEIFYEKDFPLHKEEISTLDSVIEEIIDRGAKRRHFKFEGPSAAIPVVSEEIKKKNKVDWGIRLYCVFINEDIVILLNGDVKTNLDPAKCNNVRKHFQLSQTIARKLDSLINNKMLDVNNPDCLTYYEIEI